MYHNPGDRQFLETKEPCPLICGRRRERMRRTSIVSLQSRGCSNSSRQPDIYKAAKTRSSLCITPAWQQSAGYRYLCSQEHATPTAGPETELLIRRETLSAPPPNRRTARDSDFYNDAATFHEQTAPPAIQLKVLNKSGYPLIVYAFTEKEIENRDGWKQSV